MKLELRPTSKALVAKSKSSGQLLNSAHILRKAVPDSEWWSIVSKSAKSGEPYFSAIKKLAALIVARPEIPPWPEGLFEDDDSLPRISEDEALAILERFLRSECAKLQAGTQLYPLHWDVLAAHYCPLRERYEVLRELAAAGLLVQAAAAPLHQESHLRWPLTITSEAIGRIENLRLDAKLPAVRRVEDFLRRLSDSYPMLAKAIPWAVIGASLLKLAEWGIGYFAR